MKHLGLVCCTTLGLAATVHVETVHVETAHVEEAPDLGARIEAIRAAADLPALGGALVTLEGPAEVWVAGKRRADKDVLVTKDDLWHLGSCTKSMTATLIALLVTRGDLAWETPLGEYLPDLVADGDPELLEVTLVELLSHRAGLPANPDMGLFLALRGSAKSLVEQRAELTRAALEAGPSHPPRTAFLYSNTGFVIAGHVAEVVTGKPWETLMRELLFEPLGMKSAGFGAPGTSAALDQPRGHGAGGQGLEPGPLADNPAALGPAGTVHASLADWAKYVQLHLRGFRGDVRVGELTLTRATFARLHTPYEGPGQGYGFGWVFEKRPWAGGDGTALWHNGSNTMWYCVTWLGPGNGVAALVTVNTATPAAQEATDEVATLLIREFQGRAQAGDWPSWRGPSGNGVAAADALPPLEWGEGKNVRWKRELPGLGNSSPLVYGERIYLTTAIDLAQLEPGAEARAQPGPPQADGPHRFVVLALERAGGQTAWQTVVKEETPHEKGHVTGSHASASLTRSGERLVAFFGSHGLYVLDLAGKVLWSKDLGDMTTLAAFGEGSTPAVYEDTIVVQWDHEGPSFVAAFELESGAERWRRARETDSSWGSPLVARVGGRAQVILTGSDATRAYDLATGEPIWSAAGMSKNPVNSPLVWDGVLFVMSNYQGDVIQAIDLARAKGAVDAEHGLLWTRKRDASYVPTPLVHEGRLYFLRDSTGVLNCLRAASGAEVYLGARLTGARTIHSSPIVAAGRIYLTSREGTTVVVRAGETFEILATNTLDDEFDATPAFVGAELYLRGRSHLYCLAEAE